MRAIREMLAAILFAAAATLSTFATLVRAQVGGPPGEPPALIEWPSSEYPTLQTAVDALADGGKLLIAPGVFRVPDPVYIRGKQIAIEGAGCDELPKGRGGKKVTQLVGPSPGRVVEFEAVVGLFNYEDAGGRLSGVKLSGFDAGIRASDGAAAAPRGRSLVVEGTCISDTGRGIAWSASSAFRLENVAIRRVFWNGISASLAAANIQLAPHSIFDIFVQDAANACVAFKRQIAHVSGVFGGCGPGGGISAESSALTIWNVLVLNSAGPGINVTGDFSWTDIRNANISDATGAGIVLQDPWVARIDKSKVFQTFAFFPSGIFGDGIAVLGVSDQADSANLVEVKDTFIGNSARAGISNFGGKVSLEKVTLQCAAFELNGEPLLGHSAVWIDIPLSVPGPSSNVCGCPLATGACVTVAVGLEPPPNIQPGL